jgi:hypothetical protein
MGRLAKKYVFGFRIRFYGPGTWVFYATVFCNNYFDSWIHVDLITALQ